MYTIHRNRYLSLGVALLLPMISHAQIEDVQAAFDGQHMVAYLVTGFLISVFVMLFTNRLFYYREKQVNNDTEQLNAQLAMILDSSKTQTWTYDVNTQRYVVLSERGQKETEYSPLAFSQLFDRNDFQDPHKLIQDVSRWEKRFGSLKYLHPFSVPLLMSVYRIIKIHSIGNRIPHYRKGNSPKTERDML